MGQISVKPKSLLLNLSTEPITNWLRWADTDYLAARRLLLEGLLVPGAAYANTALEKYFKTILLIKKKKTPKVHNVSILFQQVTRNKISINLNEGFLELLFKVYKLRYPDELKVGYNVAIDRTRLLSELDYSVFEIRKGFRGPSGPMGSLLEVLLERKDARLLEKNCHFGNADRKALFAEVCPRFALRVLAPGLIVSTEYETLGVPDVGNFKVEYPVKMMGNKMEGSLPLE